MSGKRASSRNNQSTNLVIIAINPGGTSRHRSSVGGSDVVRFSVIVPRDDLDNVNVLPSLDEVIPSSRKSMIIRDVGKVLIQRTTIVGVEMRRGRSDVGLARVRRRGRFGVGKTDGGEPLVVAGHGAELGLKSAAEKIRRDREDVFHDSVDKVSGPAAVPLCRKQVTVSEQSWVEQTSRCSR